MKYIYPFSTITKVTYFFFFFKKRGKKQETFYDMNLNLQTFFGVYKGRDIVLRRNYYFLITSAQADGFGMVVERGGGRGRHSRLQ